LKMLTMFLIRKKSKKSVRFARRFAKFSRARRISVLSAERVVYHPSLKNLLHWVQ